MRTWLLSAAVRRLTASSAPEAAPGRRYSGAHEPLRLLFCGSDDFSIASLRALEEARRAAPDLIHSIHVVHRPAKPTGRGLKTLRDVPVRHVAAHELDLPTHAIDTFTGWTPPLPIHLVVAVSFGLLVPPHILRLAKYGGLNVHPSLLPDLRGPAPIEHAILTHRERTGVSIQTLHPHHFDQGTVLAQTPAPGLPIPPDATAAALERELAPMGARMLVDVLRSGKHMLPHQDVSWYTGPVAHAPKTTKQHRRISFASNTMHGILAVQRALGDPWCMLTNGQRLLLHKIVTANETAISPPEEPGLWVSQHAKNPIIRAQCGATAVVDSSTYSGGKTGRGNAKVMGMLCPGAVPDNGGQERNPEHDKWLRVDEH